MASFDDSLFFSRRGYSGFHPEEDSDDEPQLPTNLIVDPQKLQSREETTPEKGSTSTTNISKDDNDKAVQQLPTGGSLSSEKLPHKPPRSTLDFKLRQLKINYDRAQGHVKGKGTAEKEAKKVFVIGVCGGSASGKTTVCRKIFQTLDNKKVVVLSQDSFYKSLTEEQRESARRSEYDFDHPDAFDHKLFAQTLKRLKSGKAVKIPIYDFKMHSRVPDQYETILAADVVIVEGILIFYTKDMRDLMHMKIFVDTDDDARLVRRIRRDMVDRGRDLTGILEQWERFVKPSFDNYIMPTKRYADIIIPRGGANDVAIDLLVQHVKLRLQDLQNNPLAWKR